MTAARPQAFVRAVIDVPNLNRSVAFYERNVGLEVVKRSDDTAFLRAGTKHHALQLRHSPAAERATVRAMGFTVQDEEHLAAIARRVDEASLPRCALDKELLAFCMDGFAVTDPNGLVWQIILDYHEFVEPPFIAFTPERVMHPFVITGRYRETVDFAVDIMGLQVSDYIADSVCFLRAADRYHHSLAVMQAPEYRVDHISFIVSSLDQLMRARARALYDGVTITMDIVRHSASQTIAFYMMDDQHGPQIELSFGHRRFEPDELVTHRPRRLAEGARTELDLWRAADDDWRDVD